jgi:glucosylceramidase
MAHVSKFIRPGARRIHLSGAGSDVIATSFRNPDGSIAVVAFNQGMEDKTYTLKAPGLESPLTLDLPAQAMQTVCLAANPQ